MYPLDPGARVQFSVPLVPGLKNTANWFIRWANNQYTVTQVQVSGPYADITLAAPILSLGPNVVTYSPPPYDVISLTGLVRAEAFTDFPLI